MANSVSFKLKADNIEKILKLTDGAIYNALSICGDKAVDYATAICPTDTGTLARSITSEVHMDENAVYVGTNVEYAAPVEFGHHQEVGRYVPAIGARLVKDFVPAQPYLRPAFQNHIAEYKSIMENELKI